MANRNQANISLNPAQVTMLSFLGLSVIGMFFLMLPISNSDGQWRDWVSAFFMSSSSTCVTGLSVVDIGKDLTVWGQLTILILMQVGGLSYMTITTILIYMTGQKLSYSQTKIFDLSNNSESKIDFADFVIKIGLLTFTVEFFGFLGLLFDSFKITGFNYDLSTEESWHQMGEAMFQAIFHAVSAFCNAGLTLYSDSLESLADNRWVIFVFALLPIIGGLGYTVLSELTSWFQDWLKSPANNKPRFSPSLHTRVSLIVTGALLVLGIVIQLWLIYAQDLSGLVTHGLDQVAAHNEWWDNLWFSFFQTVSARSSGFNSIPLNELGDPSLQLLIVWMFIGACPGGTGGGIKVTTLAVVFAIMYASLKGDKEVKLFNRSIGHSYQQRALIAFISTSVMILFFTGLISIWESPKGIGFIDQFFEVTSGFTTVGLSTGITAQLSDPSLLVISLCMIIGRPGPLLFLMALIPEDIKSKPGYPEEGILIG